MTVAAVILAASPASALADADGTPGVRRLADVAWSGGATPVVVCSFDPDGAVAAALANARRPCDPVPPERGPVAQIVNGVEAAAGWSRETDAALVWPARLAWVDAETVTSLIEAHGDDRDIVLGRRGSGDPGWPVLLPVAAPRRVARRCPRPDAGRAARGPRGGRRPVPHRRDRRPGVTHDVSTPRADLPPYDGPPEPADGARPRVGRRRRRSARRLRPPAPRTLGRRTLAG